MNTTLAVAISLIVFFAILFYYKVHKKVAGSLDARAEKIRDEIDEARQLREDAQSLLASFERRHAEIDSLAQDIVDNAKKDAQAYTEKAKVDLDQAVKTRLDSANLQIEMAEKRAIRNIKQQAIETAVTAVEQTLKQSLPQADISKSMDQALTQIKPHLH